MAAASLFADISGHNRNVDLRAYQRAGHEIIAIKLTEGATFRSDMAAARWELAGQLGLTRLGYHFARPSENTPEAEARNLLTYARKVGLGPSDQLVLDWEDPDFRRNGDEWVRRFCRAVGGPLTLLYSYGSYLAQTLRSTHGLAYWHAAYIANPVRTVPSFAERDLVAVQFTNGADGEKPHTLPGMGGPCDVNRLTVTPGQFRGLRHPAPPKEKPVSSAPHRNLSVTKPPTNGADVLALQQATRRQIDRMDLGDFGITKPAADRVFGHDSLIKARAVGRELGAPDALLTGPIRPHLQRIIRAPWRRTPLEVARGRRRMAQRKRRRKQQLSRLTLPGPPGWGGARRLLETTLDNAARAGAPLTSTKRYRVIRGSSRGSDHDWRNLLAYAHDYGTFDGAGLARSIGRELSCPFDPVGTYQRFIVTFEGRQYSVQILWGVANHRNHVHVGAHRV